MIIMKCCAVCLSVSEWRTLRVGVWEGRYNCVMIMMKCHAVSLSLSDCRTWGVGGGITVL